MDETHLYSACIRSISEAPGSAISSLSDCLAPELLKDDDDVLGDGSSRSSGGGSFTLSSFAVVDGRFFRGFFLGGSA